MPNSDIKRHIASQVQNILKNTVFAGADAPEDVIAVEVLATSTLGTQIKVRTVARGVHYFTVKVTENM